MNDADRRQTSDGFDHDAMFADIVAHWNDAAAEPAPRPSADEAPGDEESGAHPAESGAHTAEEPPVDHHHFHADPPAALPTPAQPQAIPAPQAWRAHEVDPEYEEHFEPPPTAPLPVGDLQFWAIIAGMCGGPLLLLYLVLFNREAGSGWMLTAIAMSVGGFALLISRLPRDHEDGDDGARL
ncbi:MAG TPA: hypothetical protein VIJ07_04940 [Dermatophilaceae bacterium]|jgi:hypothetical protein